MTSAREFIRFLKAAENPLDRLRLHLRVGQSLQSDAATGDILAWLELIVEAYELPAGALQGVEAAAIDTVCGIPVAGPLVAMGMPAHRAVQCAYWGGLLRIARIAQVNIFSLADRLGSLPAPPAPGDDYYSTSDFRYPACFSFLCSAPNPSAPIHLLGQIARLIHTNAAFHCSVGILGNLPAHPKRMDVLGEVLPAVAIFLAEVLEASPRSAMMVFEACCRQMDDCVRTVTSRYLPEVCEALSRDPRIGRGPVISVVNPQVAVTVEAFRSLLAVGGYLSGAKQEKDARSALGAYHRLIAECRNHPIRNGRVTNASAVDDFVFWSDGNVWPRTVGEAETLARLLLLEDLGNPLFNGLPREHQVLFPRGDGFVLLVVPRHMVPRMRGRTPVPVETACGLFPILTWVLSDTDTLGRFVIDSPLGQWELLLQAVLDSKPLTVKDLIATSGEVAALGAGVIAGKELGALLFPDLELVAEVGGAMLSHVATNWARRALHAVRE